jgi:hypothetical protein
MKTCGKVLLISALDGGEWSASRPGHFTPGERALGSHWIRGWVGPGTALDRLDDVEMRKILPIPGLELRPSGRPVHCYTDCAIPVPHETLFKNLPPKSPLFLIQLSVCSRIICWRDDVWSCFMVFDWNCLSGRSRLGAAEMRLLASLFLSDRLQQLQSRWTDLHGVWCWGVYLKHVDTFQFCVKIVQLVYSE